MSIDNHRLFTSSKRKSVRWPTFRVAEGDEHFAFCTRLTRPRFARDPSTLLIPPDLSFEICVMREVGTTSWFLDPISTCMHPVIRMRSNRIDWDSQQWALWTPRCSDTGDPLHQASFSPFCFFLNTMQLFARLYKILFVKRRVAKSASFPSFSRLDPTTMSVTRSLKAVRRIRYFPINPSLSAASTSAIQRRYASHGEHYNEPSGFLFNELVRWRYSFGYIHKGGRKCSLFGVKQPRKDGSKRQREDWELIWLFGMGGSLVLAAGIFYFRPDTRCVDHVRGTIH